MNDIEGSIHWMKPSRTHSQKMLNQASMIKIQSFEMWHWVVRYMSTKILEDPPISF
jgi:hypothetical protein